MNNLLWYIQQLWNRAVIKTDNLGDGDVSIHQPHHEIHEEHGYSLSYPITVPAANEVEIRIQTNTAPIHMVWSYTNDAAYTVTVFEDTSKTHVGGNVLAPKNRFRDSSNISTTLVCHTPAGAGDGNIIWEFAGGANKVVTTATNRNEFILKKNAAYLINLSGAQNDLAHLLFDWYERHSG